MAGPEARMIEHAEPLLTLDPEPTVFTRVYFDEALTLAYPLGYCIAANVCGAYMVADCEAAVYAQRDSQIVPEHQERHRDFVFSLAFLHERAKEIRRGIDAQAAAGENTTRVYAWHKLTHHLAQLEAIGAREALLPAAHNLQFARQLWKAGAEQKMLRYGEDGPQMKGACIRIVGGSADTEIIASAQITSTNNARVFESTVRPVLDYLTSKKIAAYYDAGVPA
jgi:hypothetical protein